MSIGQLNSSVGMARVLRRAASVLFLSAALGRADSFDDLRQEWRDFMTGGTNLNLSDPAVSSKVNGYASNANSRWSSMNTNAGRTFLWSDAASTTISADLTTSYSRLRDMALGWATKGSSVYSNATLGADIVSALDWMYTNRYNETKTYYDNWWDWEIGTPQALNDCMVLMYPVLTGAQITNYCKAVDKFTPNVSPSPLVGTMTGANRVWKAEAVAVRGVVEKNSAKLTAARDGLSDVSGGGANSVFKYVTSGDGFYADGSFIQHGRHPYTAGYGLYLFRDLVPMLVWLDGSAWAVTDAQRTNIVNWAFNSFEPVLYNGALLENLRGREISRTYTGYSVGQSALTTMLRLAQTAPTNDATRLKRLIKYMDQADTTSALTNYVSIDLVPVAEQLLADATITPRGELIGHYQFPSMDRVMHLRPGFAFSLALSSSRIYNFESINNENLKGWFTSDGMTYLMNPGDPTQFTDAYWPTIDPYRLPGTTVDLTTRTNAVGDDYLSPENWVGCVTFSNTFGAVGMALDAFGSSLVAKKSWFMFDNEIVCLGAGITCASASNVITTIENRRLNSTGNTPFTADGAAMSTALGWSSNFTALTWCHLTNSGGYFFPGGANVRASRVARTGAWSDINGGGSTGLLTRNYLNLWLDHGSAPSGGTYAYTLLPNFTAAQTAAYAATADIQIVENSTQAQAVRENTLGLLAVNFWNAAAKTVDFITCSNKASVIVREKPEELMLAVSDPTQTNTGSVFLTLDRSALAVGALDAGVTVSQLSPTIKLSVSMNGRRGQTATARFVTYTNSPPVISPVAPQLITAGDPFVLTVSAADTGLNPQSVRFSLLNPPAGATVNASSGAISWPTTAGDAGTSNLFTVVVTEAGWVTNILAVADAQVRDGSFTNINYGSDTNLTLRRSTTGNNWEAYLKFNLPVVAGSVAGGALRLVVNSASFPGTHAVCVASNTTWLESSLTWSNRPGSSTNILATWIPGAAGTTSRVDIASAILNAVASNVPVSLRLFATNTTANGLVTYGAREGSANNAPVLELIWTNGSLLTVTQTFWVTVVPSNQPPVLSSLAGSSVIGGAWFTTTNTASDPDVPAQRLLFSLLSAPGTATINPTTGLIAWRPTVADSGTSNLFTVVVTEDGWQTNLPAVADAYVRDGSFTNANFGTSNTLAARLSSVGNTYESYLRFNLPTLPGGFREARLVLTPTVVSFPGTHAVAYVTNNTWGETTVTWSNRPASGAALATWLPVLGQSTWADVSSAAQTAITGAGVLSLRVYASTVGAVGTVNYPARESGATNQPWLAVISTNLTSRSATNSFWVTVNAPAQPMIQSASWNGSQFQLSITGQFGPDYLVQGTTNLSAAFWPTLFTTNSPALPFQWSDTNTTRAQFFYRVQLGP